MLSTLAAPWPGLSCVQSLRVLVFPLASSSGPLPAYTDASRNSPHPIAPLPPNKFSWCNCFRPMLYQHCHYLTLFFLSHARHSRLFGLMSFYPSSPFAFQGLLSFFIFQVLTSGLTVTSFPSIGLLSSSYYSAWPGRTTEPSDRACPLLPLLLEPAHM